MPKIGLRMVKTAISVFICLIFRVILIILTDEQTATLIYTPFFAGIAAVYSMQDNKTNTLRQARIRSVGSLIGGIYGMIIILIFQELSYSIFTNVSMEFTLLLEYIFVAIAIIPLICITVVSGQANATFITCLTYLSVTISIRNNFDEHVFFSLYDNLAKYHVVFFALNRILSSLLGVFVSIGINAIKIPHKKNDGILFITGLDGTLLSKDKKINGYVKYKLNNLIGNGANITIATTRSPAFLLKVLDGININLPVIIMNGTALFNFNDKTYMNVVNIDRKTGSKLETFLKENNQSAFTHSIADDILYIYYNEFQNEGQRKFYLERKNSYFKNFIKGNIPDENDVIFYILIDRSNNILSLYDKLKKQTFAKELSLTVYENEQFPGYHFMKIHSTSASKMKAVQALDIYSNSFIVALGSQSYDIPVMMRADYAIAPDTADDNVKQHADYLIKNSSPEEFIKVMSKIYYKRNYKSKYTHRENRIHI